METIILAHQHMRWLVIGLAVITTIKLAISLFSSKELGKADSILVRIYGLVLTIQVLIGMTQLAMRWSDFGDGLRYRLEHAFIMLVAVGMVHMTARWRQVPPQIAVRNTTLMIFGSLVLIILAILILPQGSHALGLE